MLNCTGKRNKLPTCNTQVKRAKACKLKLPKMRGYGAMSSSLDSSEDEAPKKKAKMQANGEGSAKRMGAYPKDRPYAGAPNRSLWKSPGQKGMADNKLYPVSIASREYDFVEENFMKTMKMIACIIRIERVENGRQQETFALQKRNIVMDIRAQLALTEKNLTENQLVRMLFHGTKQTAIQNIVNNSSAGFIPLLSGSSTGAACGYGTYFAVRLSSQSSLF